MKTKLFFLFLLAFLSTKSLWSQSKPIDTSTVYSLVEENASFPGGLDAFHQFIKDNLIYPQAALNKHIEGRVFVSFVVEINGSLSQIKVIRGLGSGCDEEALRIVKLMPKWKPAKLKNIQVRSSFNLPIDFQLSKENAADEEIILIEPSTQKPDTETTETENEGDEVFVFVEDQPKYPGGDEARLKYLRDNIHYPKEAKEHNIQGTVYITFVIEEDGSISNVKVLRGIGGGCDEESVRVLTEMPNWIPGKQKGKPVRCQYNMPIRFAMVSDGPTTKAKGKKSKRKSR
jgi:TonB family protein